LIRSADLRGAARALPCARGIPYILYIKKQDPEALLSNEKL